MKAAVEILLPRRKKQSKQCYTDGVMLVYIKKLRQMDYKIEMMSAEVRSCYELGRYIAI